MFEINIFAAKPLYDINKKFAKVIYKSQKKEYNSRVIFFEGK